MRRVSWLGAQGRKYSGERESDVPFKKLLVANRGEIACRVMKTAKQMGIGTVAVYSEADANAKHVREADEAVLVGPAASSDSYLRIDRIVEAVKSSGAEAVHPGYGFLSENSKFVKALEDNNVAFIGPGSFAMRAMGDKIESKKLAKEAGVNVIPGFVGEVDTADDAVRIANDIGYPVMIKASAGGGGKGMRVSWDDAETVEGFNLSRAEAESSFGDNRMLIEKFIDEPRHIELQILADKHGNCVYLAERECSIQRRNQKVLEEAPSPFIDPETRRRMGEQAVALAKAVDYHSAGTVEMLVDSQKNFYFLEMNTRLQVEHPVTEYITGQDIVEHMINIAAGRPLPFKQEDVRIRGWATEARVYAEDPLRSFLPSIGRLLRYREPPKMIPLPRGVLAESRTDAGVVEGSEISVHYDPLISKLITYGSSRQDSIDAMKVALDSYVIGGLGNNLCFLRNMMDHPRYVSGNITTKFIEEEFPDGFKTPQLTALEGADLSLGAALLHTIRLVEKGSLNDRLTPAPDDPEDSTEAHTFYVRIEPPADSDASATVRRIDIFPSFGSQNGGEHNNDFDNEILNGDEGEHGDNEMDFGSAPSMAFLDGEEQSSSTYNYNVCIDGEPIKLAAINFHGSPNFFSVSFPEEGAHQPIICQLRRGDHRGYQILFHGSPYDIQVYNEREFELCSHMPIKEKQDLSDFLLSPMPGTVLQLHVKEGDVVAEGAPLCIVEAMKMQNVLTAERNAVVKSISVPVGASVAVDEVLIEFEPEET